MPEPLHCLAATPKGSRNEYERLGAIKLDRFLVAWVVRPTDCELALRTIDESRAGWREASS